MLDSAATSLFAALSSIGTRSARSHSFSGSFGTALCAGLSAFAPLASLASASAASASVVAARLRQPLQHRHVFSVYIALGRRTPAAPLALPV
eukprot:1180475-Alexandrium_andersonii.AAC.1